LDRYYKPDDHTHYTALRAVLDSYVVYNEHFSSILRHINPTTGLFDKISDLRLQEGSWYAYYKLGVDDFNNIINTIPDVENIGITKFKTITSGDSISTQSEEYTFTGDQRGEIQHQNNYIKDKLFTLSFSMQCEDWSRPTGSQIIGDYAGSGFGVFTGYDTSLININHIHRSGSNTDHVEILNSRFDTITTISVDKYNSSDIVWVFNESSFDNVYVLLISNHTNMYKGFASVELYEFREYDFNGSLKRSSVLDLSTQPHIKIQENRRKSEGINIHDRHTRTWITNNYIIDGTDMMVNYNIDDQIALRLSTVI